MTQLRFYFSKHLAKYFFRCQDKDLLFIFFLSLGDFSFFFVSVAFGVSLDFETFFAVEFCWDLDTLFPVGVILDLETFCDVGIWSDFETFCDVGISSDLETFFDVDVRSKFETFFDFDNPFATAS